MKNKTNKQQQQTITILLEIMLGGINYIPVHHQEFKRSFFFVLFVVCVYINITFENVGKGNKLKIQMAKSAVDGTFKFVFMTLDIVLLRCKFEISNQ